MVLTPLMFTPPVLAPRLAPVAIIAADVIGRRWVGAFNDHRGGRIALDHYRGWCHVDGQRGGTGGEEAEY